MKKWNKILIVCILAILSFILTVFNQPGNITVAYIISKTPVSENEFAYKTEDDSEKPPEETETTDEPETPKETDITTEPETPKETDAPTEPETPKETDTPTEPETPKGTEAPTESETPEETDVTTESETLPEEPETTITFQTLENPSETSKLSELESTTKKGQKNSHNPSTGDKNIAYLIILSMIISMMIFSILSKRKIR